MTSMQVTSKKQTGGIEWLPLEVLQHFPERRRRRRRRRRKRDENGLGLRRAKGLLEGKKRGEEGKNDALLPGIRDDRVAEDFKTSVKIFLSRVGLFAVWACCSQGSSQEALTPKSICTGFWHLKQHVVPQFEPEWSSVSISGL
ncbi:hypothetical protein JOB18_046341 [Solea senegalensis]|uniref:Uncharacterized protein n=1 Tax=Solea senegalensis TaxID=28829 RepID=A0AAV6R0A7_SOLSE|nr:hypothetical protein JOB18_046341 [Solea senegalensis]